MKLKIEIRNRFTGKVIFEFETENNTISKTINEAVRLASEKGERADLSWADLSKANLSVIKNDIWAILLRSNEVDFLLNSLKNGKVDG